MEHKRVELPGGTPAGSSAGAFMHGEKKPFFSI